MSERDMEDEENTSVQKLDLQPGRQERQKLRNQTSCSTIRATKKAVFVTSHSG